jgi:signal transduction histidine kinase
MVPPGVNGPLPDVQFLVVDDLEENLFAFAQVLRRDGVELVLARSGKAALEALLVRDFALAIIDVQMPEMGGVELAELMRGAERTRHVPIILVTAGAHERTGLFRGYEAGAVDFLYKPIEPVVLRNKAETFYELYRQKQQLARRTEELRARNDELVRAQTVAEAASRAKDEFLANVSHEIRTPMNAIMGLTDLVLESPLDAKQRRSLGIVQSAAGHLLATINDLLDFSKMEAGKVELDLHPFALREAVGDVVRALAPRAQTKGLRLSYDVAAEAPHELVGDGHRLRQVLMNLVGNAVKFTERGEVALDVSWRAGEGERDAWLRFAVRDTGIGIHRDKQRAIFRAFEQEDMSTTRRYGGTGLGLTIASRLIDLMGGELTVQSEPGQGSTFSFELRMEHARAQGERVAEPSRAGADAASHGVAHRTGLRVLVAEDDEFSQELLQGLLAGWGHHVRIAPSGRDALSCIEAGQAFDVLLLDVHMPELDGFGVIGAIRERERAGGARLPVIAVTARSRKEDLERCLAAGMDRFVTKPIRAAELRAAIDELAHTPSRVAVGALSAVVTPLGTSSRCSTG